MERDAIERALEAYFASHPRELVAAYLFGSTARGAATKDSDVDVALLFASAPQPSLASLPFDMEGEIERLLGRPVDVVVLNTAPLDLIHRVLRDGRLVLDRDRAARIRFEVRARADYFDLEPVLRRYRRQRVGDR